MRTAWTAAELMDTEFPDPKWAVPSLISEGVNLLAGPPKVGKSWMSLGLGLSVAAGGDPRGPACARRSDSGHTVPFAATGRQRGHRQLAGPQP
ncbi:AAA family ATPase [Streptomyces lydicus]|uniref:AAA family ATPase n=1 Tax=Streptomyces lydicus TaxID=47763 RepID=UPI0037AE4468